MKIAGRLWKSRKSDFWLAEVAILDLATQAKTIEEIPDMVKDAIEGLVDAKKFKVEVQRRKNDIFIESNDPKLLTALILKRQRTRQRLTLEEVTANLGAKSINEYAQYERGKHLPSLEKLENLLKAIDPKHTPVLSYA
ncbi:MAG TPA: helix-turn-helix transcriptional regulator [Myxococcota bacterium]|nr:helix-turn-helix transcriptional regulator [Myxococcota bacterium]